MFTTNGPYPWSFVTQIFHNGQPGHGGNLLLYITPVSPANQNHTIIIKGLKANITYIYLSNELYSDNTRVRILICFGQHQVI